MAVPRRSPSRTLAREQLVAIVEHKKRGSSDEEAWTGSQPEARSNVGDFGVARPAGRGSRLGAARFDPDHHQRQGPPFCVRRAVTGATNSPDWTSPHDDLY